MNCCAHVSRFYAGRRNLHIFVSGSDSFRFFVFLVCAFDDLGYREAAILAFFAVNVSLHFCLVPLHSWSDARKHGSHVMLRGYFTV